MHADEETRSTRDVVVAAETGSGKTLAYLVPVFSNLLRNGHGRGDGEGDGGEGGAVGRLGALILAPNATLCEQVKRVADSLTGDDGEPLLKTHALTPDTSMPSNQASNRSSSGGLPDVVVATPARAAEDVLEFTKGVGAEGISPKRRSTSATSSSTRRISCCPAGTCGPCAGRSTCCTGRRSSRRWV